MTLYTDLIDAGCQVETSGGDLYVKDTPEARVILERYGRRTDLWSVRSFAFDAESWLDIPFGYETEFGIKGEQPK